MFEDAGQDKLLVHDLDPCPPQLSEDGLVLWTGQDEGVVRRGGGRGIQVHPSSTQDYLFKLGRTRNNLKGINIK